MKIMKDLHYFTVSFGNSWFTDRNETFMVLGSSATSVKAAVKIGYPEALCIKVVKVKGS